MTGRLIVFEGIEGCGKTTQACYLNAWLLERGFNVVQTREPGGTRLGIAIRQLLLDSSTEEMENTAELLLYAADRAQHVQVLRRHLAQGSIILCDRYTDSTIAYQGYGRGLDRRVIDQLNAIATGGLTSDLTLWLDIEVEVGLNRVKQRGASDRIEQASIDFHHRVRQGFQELAEAYPDRIVRIDANLDKHAIAQQVQMVISERLLELM